MNAKFLQNYVVLHRLTELTSRKQGRVIEEMQDL